MIVDCDTCAVRGTGCAGCAIHALFHTPPEIERLTPDEIQAIEVLARAGLDPEIVEVPDESVPRTPLRLVPLRRDVA
ncbi:hypothetical protein [Catenuloplanes atrovinosus]|uniref:Uncharacterized protein n=1 Tax=Catenuloplanes atrovinosus TaxID=137266 RepID=A0AAE3YRF9_9ACTN|nr:hypothetical protein [Catenuloplanes atrovinosus]MDR7278255.1 hypothetical protein [Catenuloplanes atrovinosus]